MQTAIIILSYLILCGLGAATFALAGLVLFSLFQKRMFSGGRWSPIWMDDIYNRFTSPAFCLGIILALAGVIGARVGGKMADDFTTWIYPPAASSIATNIDLTNAPGSITWQADRKVELDCVTVQANPYKGEQAWQSAPCLGDR